MKVSRNFVILFIWSRCFSFRKTLQIDGPYDEVFYQKLLDLSTEDDGTVAFALRKVSRLIEKHCIPEVLIPLPSTTVTAQNSRDLFLFIYLILVFLRQGFSV